MHKMRSFIRNTFSAENSEKFRQEKFRHNHLCIFALSVYLTFEQLYYGFCISEPGSLRQKIFIGTAGLMLAYTAISALIHAKKTGQLTRGHKIYELSFGLSGFAIAIARSLILQNHTFALPSIYIAVIYGFAVFFYLSPLVSFGIYFITCASVLILLPLFHPEIVLITYVQDIVTNNFIAWIASVISYRRYVREYRCQQTISDKNEELQAKTANIQKTNQTLQYMSNIDDLTNIYNRRKLNEFLELEYERCRAAGKNISLILIDVDFFKAINDTYGHSAGDKVLEQFGKLLKQNVSLNNIVGRWGGEEFLMICPETNLEEAVCLAEKIRRMVQNDDFKLENQVTCSLGVATNQNIDTITNLIIRADRGLYRAKALGRNRVEEG
ncbi:diguanylate cyclase [Syntrophobotulus glycolicus DSM 8271]|uniref:Diguanylate cyclase n=1 Tax=Syntrophobotulus glycolicus (strain DSM 8271 / FlGlyR) TaxID=645991 RepID=F0SWE8_SYNGF|nr:GGDEF domain-containing protein [Syntrophobotulus glycolicus]ADY55714.1 diguanylate cyclase [Syntrophobotulus glycolicus DSM 8271]